LEGNLIEYRTKYMMEQNTRVLVFPDIV